MNGYSEAISSVRPLPESQQPRAPARRAAGRVDAILPVVLDVAIALAAMLGHRLAHKTPQISDQQGSCTRGALLARLFAPPAA